MAKNKVSVSMRTRREDDSPLPGSRNFGDPDAPEFPPFLIGKHVGGVRCEDLPAEVWGLLSVQHTDEDIAERNAGKQESAARVTRSELDGAIQERRDFRESEMEPWQAPDPMRALADAHVRPGFRAKFLSEQKLNKEGNYGRGWEVVLDEKGKPVKLGTLVLGQMPVGKAEQRNAHYRAKSEAAIAEVYRAAKEKGLKSDDEMKQGSEGVRHAASEDLS